MHEVAHEVQPGSPIAVLSGPTFAHEVAAGLPTAVTLAVEDAALGERLVARHRPARFPALSVRRRRRRRGRRRGQERARHRLRRGRGPRARPERPRRPDLARLRRDDPLRPRQGRARRDAGRASPGSATSSSPAPRPARAISASARASARARAPADLLADRRTVAEGAFTAPVLQARRRGARRRHADRRRGLRPARRRRRRSTRWSARLLARPRLTAAEGVSEVPGRSPYSPSRRSGSAPSLGAAALLARFGLGRLRHAAGSSTDRRAA